MSLAISLKQPLILAIRITRKHVAILGSVVTLSTVGALAGPSVYHNVVSGGGSPPPGTANIWIDTNGGSCLDSASPVAYSDAQACTWQAANATCDNNDNVLIKGGSYSSVLNIRGWNGRSAPCFITTATSEVVTVGQFNMGSWRDTSGDPGGTAACVYGNNSLSTRWITLVGPIKTTRMWADCSDHISIDLMDMDNTTDRADANQPWSAQIGTTNFRFTNGKIHGALNPNAMAIIGGSGPFFIDNNDIYDDLNNTNGTIHDECFRGETANNVTFARNHLWSCNVMDVFITTGGGTSDGAVNWTIENNIFEAPTGSIANADNGLVFRYSNIDDGNTPNPNGVIVRYNTFGSTGLSIDGVQNAPTGAGMQVYGNYFNTQAPCGLVNTTYSYNVTPTGTPNCGGTGAQSFAAATLQSGFVNYHPYSGNGGSVSEPTGNYHLQSSSPLKNIGGPTFPTIDRDGVSRPQGATVDVGGYERVGG